MSDRLYFDYAASAPLRPAALEATMRALEAGGNAASLHQRGRAASARVEAARKQVGALVGRGPRAVLFTSGGTEANNLALFGAMRAGRGKRLIVSAIEHKAVLAPAEALVADGFEVVRIGVDADGVLRLDELAAALTPDTALVSVMAVNNEMGAVQPLADIARLAHAAGALFHTDAVQAGYLDLAGSEADLISLSAHKLGGPLGVGALLLAPGVGLSSVQFGGDHERGMRAGTLNVPGIAGFGAAAAELAAARASETARVEALAERLRHGLAEALPWARVLGRDEARAAHIVSLVLPGLEGEALVTQLDFAGLAASSGAACSAISSEPSHVLPALGLDAASVAGSLRLSLGWATTAPEVEAALRVVSEVASSLKHLPPLAL